MSSLQPGSSARNSPDQRLAAGDTQVLGPDHHRPGLHALFEPVVEPVDAIPPQRPQVVLHRVEAMLPRHHGHAGRDRAVALDDDVHFASQPQAEALIVVGIPFARLGIARRGAPLDRAAGKLVVGDDARPFGVMLQHQVDVLVAVLETATRLADQLVAPVRLIAAIPRPARASLARGSRLFGIGRSRLARTLNELPHLVG